LLEINIMKCHLELNMNLLIREKAYCHYYMNYQTGEKSGVVLATFTSHVSEELLRET